MSAQAKCNVCGKMIPFPNTKHECITQSPVKVEFQHPDWHYSVKISNDNTKGEKRVTVTVHSDDNGDAARNKAHELYAAEMSS